MATPTLEMHPKLDLETRDDVDEDEISSIEEVRMTVNNTDDPTLPVLTFRMWLLGLLSCGILSFLNQYFAYQTGSQIITVQATTLLIGHFLARVLPRTQFGLFGFGSRRFSLNPGPFNIKEHVLILIFANTGSAFGSGSAYAVGIVTIIKAFYHQNISFWVSWLLIITTQILGYGWAGLLRKYVVEPSHMWWPATLVQVSLFRNHREEEEWRRCWRSRHRTRYQPSSPPRRDRSQKARLRRIASTGQRRCGQRISARRLSGNGRTTTH